MIVIKVEQISANDGAVLEIGRAIITNDGASHDRTRGDYNVYAGAGVQRAMTPG